MFNELEEIREALKSLLYLITRDNSEEVLGCVERTLQMLIYQVEDLMLQVREND